MELPPDQARRLVFETLAPQTARERAQVKALVLMAEESGKGLLRLVECVSINADLPFSLSIHTARQML